MFIKYFKNRKSQDEIIMKIYKQHLPLRSANKILYFQVGKGNILFILAWFSNGVQINVNTCPPKKNPDNVNKSVFNKRNKISTFYFFRGAGE